MESLKTYKILNIYIHIKCVGGGGGGGGGASISSSSTDPVLLHVKFQNYSVDFQTHTLSCTVYFCEHVIRSFKKKTNERLDT